MTTPFIDCEADVHVMAELTQSTYREPGKELGSSAAVSVMRSVRANTHQGPRHPVSHCMAGYMGAISLLLPRTQTLANGTGPYMFL